MLQSQMRLVTQLVCISMAAICFQACDNAQTVSDTKADPVGRRILGRAAVFEADAVDAVELSQSIAKRRELAWRIFSKVTQPVNIAGDASGVVTAPRFLTWYERQEIVQLASPMFRDPATRPLPGAVGFDPSIIEQVLSTAFPTIAIDPNQVGRDPFVSSPGGVGYHGNMAPTMFSEGMLRHYLLKANSIIDCVIDPNADLIAAKARGEVQSFSPCMDEEFPRDAVMLKAQWEPVDAVLNKVIMANFPTDAAAMTHILGPNSTTQAMHSTPVEAALDPDKMFIVRDRSGAAYALRALHVVTKETDEWVWATYWWSPEPETDFGSDRPAAIQGSWRNYKMCTQTTFMEQDPDSTGGAIDADLAAAMQVVTDPLGKMRTPSGTAGWCANPFVEGSFARMTCIGCHQSGGNIGAPIDNELKVKNFPGDLSFAFDSFRSMLRIARGSKGAETRNF